MTRTSFGKLLIAAATVALTACGGGGGGGPSFSPAPPSTPEPPPPPPQPTSQLNIIQSAPTGEFASVGVRYSSVYGDGDLMDKLSLAQKDQARLRYDAASNTYEVMLPGTSWATLVTVDQSLPDWARTMSPDGGPYADAILFSLERTSVNGDDPYPSSTLARYTDSNTNYGGWIAVGIPTPAAALPVAGSATYAGVVGGTTDIMGEDGWGGVQPLLVTGGVTLTFDFAQSSLAGSMSLMLGSSQNIGTFNFVDTIYSAGNYSGRFDTALNGENAFYGSLTGSSAQELIGAWAVPFLYSVDGKVHQAAGAWIAKD